MVLDEFQKQLVFRIEDEWLENDDIYLWFGKSEERLDTKGRRIFNKALG